jgi:riboflavin biosynthesis pyrimidine reductase
MFTTPELPVFIGSPSGVVGALRTRLRERPWIEVIDGGNPLTMTALVRSLYDRGLRVISAIGGRQTAASLIREGLVADVYLTTSPITAGEPGTPFYTGEPPRVRALLEKAGRGAETGVRFEHLEIQNRRPDEM